MVPPSSTKKSQAGSRRGAKEEAKDHQLTAKAVKKVGAAVPGNAQKQIQIVADEEDRSGNDMTHNSTTTAGKKRGRKLTDPQKYQFESQKKIDELQHKLKTDKKLSSSEKQKIRNQISAQRSRLNKKQEHG